MLTFAGADVAEFPPTSKAIAVSMCAPKDLPGLQLTEYGALKSLESAAPSR